MDNFLNDIPSLSNISYDKSQNSTNSFQACVSQKCDEENNNKNKINKKIMCEKCYYFPQVYLNHDGYSLNINCDCKEYEQMEIDYFMNNFVIEKEIDNFNNFSKKIEFDNYCYCDKHLGEKFAYYCTVCEANLCTECYRETNDHSKHKIINFNGSELINKINEIKEIIKDGDKYIIFLKIIRVILEVYEYYPCYNGSISINNIYNFLAENINISNDKQVIKHEKMKEYYKVKLEKQLRQVLENKNEDILRAIRINKKNFYLDMLSNINFKSLISIELSDNNIEDLTPLLNSKFPVLNKLNLSTNKIDDENANKIFKIEMPNLSFLNLYENNLTKFDFFKNIHIFRNLKKLFTGFNQFNEEISDIDENTIYDCSTIEILGFSKNMFTDNTIHLISKFDFRNLKTLNLSYNNLSSLSFVDKLKCKIENLEIIKLISNNISEYYPLIKFTNLKEIELNNNNISNIGNISDFVKHFKQLEKIDFSENEFDKNDIVIKRIIDKTINEYSKILESIRNEKTPDKTLIKKLEIKY